MVKSETRTHAATMSYSFTNPVPLAQDEFGNIGNADTGVGCGPRTAYQAMTQTLPPRLGVQISQEAVSDGVYGLGNYGSCPGLGAGCNANSAIANTSAITYQFNNPVPALNARYTQKYNIPSPDAAMKALNLQAVKDAATGTCPNGPTSVFRCANNQAFIQTTKLPQFTGTYDQTSEISLSGPLTQSVLDTTVMRMKPTSTPTFSLAPISAVEQVDAFHQAQFADACGLACDCESADGMI